MNSPRFLAVIPARTGSKGIPNKNFLKLGNKKVIEYSIEHAKKLQDCCDVVISTDNYHFLREFAQNAEIDSAKFSESYFKEIVEVDSSTFLHLRRKSLAEDETPIVEVLQNILEELSRIERNYEGVLLLQPTVPFRSEKDLQHIRSFLKSEARENNSLVSFKQLSDAHPARMYERERNNAFRNLGFYSEHEQTRRQKLPKVFLRDGCYYFIGRQLVTSGKQIGERPCGVIRQFPWTINLDAEEDYLLAQIALEKYKLIFQSEGVI